LLKKKALILKTNLLGKYLGPKWKTQAHDLTCLLQNDPAWNLCKIILVRAV